MAQKNIVLHHMVSEPERGFGVLGSSDSYTVFISTARGYGSVIEALIERGFYYAWFFGPVSTKPE